MLHLGIFEIEAVDITEARDLNSRVGGHLASVGAADASDDSD
jgi:hypothetical protein